MDIITQPVIFHLIIPSFILFNCEKNIEGFNPLQKCGKKVTAAYLSNKDLDFLNKEKDNCIDAERELNTKKAAESDPEKKVDDFIKFLPVLAYDGTSMQQIDATSILDVSISGTSATLLARRWESICQMSQHAMR